MGSWACPEFCSPGQITDQSPIQADGGVEEGIVNKMGGTRFPVPLDERIDGLQIGRPDGTGIRQQFQIFLQVSEDRWFLKRKLQLISVEHMKDHHIASPGTELLQPSYHLFRFI